MWKDNEPRTEWWGSDWPGLLTRILLTLCLFAAHDYHKATTYLPTPQVLIWGLTQHFAARSAEVFSHVYFCFSRFLCKFLFLSLSLFHLFHSLSLAHYISLSQNFSPLSFSLSLSLTIFLCHLYILSYIFYT